MHIEDFNTWFELRKVVTGKSKEMDNLKDIFFDCYENFFTQKNDELEDKINKLEFDVYSLEGDNEELEMKRDILEDGLKEIVSFIKEAESLDKLKVKMKEYGYM